VVSAVVLRESQEAGLAAVGWVSGAAAGSDMGASSKKGMIIETAVSTTHDIMCQEKEPPRGLFQVFE
jgi:hypothetical protein